MLLSVSPDEPPNAAELLYWACVELPPGVPPPEPQSAPVPDIKPAVLTWRHCVDPVMPVFVMLENEPVELLIGMPESEPVTDPLKTNALGVPRAGVTNVGDVDRSTLPLPLVGISPNVLLLL